MFFKKKPLTKDFNTDSIYSNVALDIVAKYLFNYQTVNIQTRKRMLEIIIPGLRNWAKTELSAEPELQEAYLYWLKHYEEKLLKYSRILVTKEYLNKYQPPDFK